MCDLLHDSSGEESDVEFKINKQYASKYDNWRQKEELQKLKDRYGDDVKDLHSSSSSSETEDENIEVNPSLEKDFFKTLSCLMSQDPKIYDKDTNFFKSTENEAPSENKKKKKKEKPIYLKDYERNLILEKGGIFTDEEDSDNQEVKKGRSSPTYVEEQKHIKESFKTALEDSDEDEEDLFKEKKKTKAELVQEESDYIAWLKGKKDSLNDGTKDDMKFLREYWNDPKLDSDEAFLRDYILNRKYLDTEDADRIPAYDEIAHDSEDLSEDEKTLKKQEEFEHKFNFRFEEPDAEFIKHYPRTMSDSLRKKNNQRKLKREERKTRKLEEKERKREELKRLKALKRKEILEKLEKLKKITGNTNVGFDDDDVEGEFNPEAHDRKMHQIFDDEYYQTEDVEKPEFPEDEEMDEYEAEDWDNWVRQENIQNGNYDDDEGPHCEDPDFNMDADYDPRTEFQNEMRDATMTRKRKHKSKFAEIMSKSKPIFNPDDETFENYLDEYYKLDYEDLIGDLPCRFKYRKVVANDFGLSTQEILSADDKELNKWCSLKKAYQYRTKEQEQYDVHAYHVKAQNENKKKKILLSIYAEPEQEEKTISKKKRKKKRKHDVDSIEAINADVSEESKQTLANENVSKKKKSCDGKLDNTEILTKETAATQNPISIEGTKPLNDKKTNKAKQVTQFVTNEVPKLGESTQNKKQKKKFKNKKNQQRTLKNDQKNTRISDDRLRAYGINPKKFKHKKHKF